MILQARHERIRHRRRRIRRFNGKALPAGVAGARVKRVRKIFDGDVANGLRTVKCRGVQIEETRNVYRGLCGIMRVAIDDRPRQDCMTFLSTIFGRRRPLDAVRSEPDRYCRMCGEGGASSLGFVEPTHPAQFHTNKFQLVLCPSCDVVYLDPLPTAEDLNLLYEQSVQFADAHYTDPVRVEKILDYYATAVHNLGLLPERGVRALEIGAGLAWVSRVCKNADPTTFTVAQDVSGECETSCPWVDSYFVGALDAMPEKGPYQLISLTHVIEHLPDPAAILRSIATLLAPGGKLFVTAPFRPSGWMPTRGIEPWRTYSYLHVPAHITYLSRRWFEKQAQSYDLEIAHWDNSHEGGQAFELVMRRT